MGVLVPPPCSSLVPPHRILTKTYSDDTPGVTYEYHLAGSSSAPNIGQLKRFYSNVGSTIYSSYDAFGNVTASTQTTTGTLDQTFNYDWYLNGSLKSLTYPSGRVVNYSVDDAGRTNKVYSATKTYADLTAPGITYPFAPDGRIAQMKLGNNLWETRDYRTPGTTTTYRLGTALGAGDRLQLEYNYSGTANNGNLANQITTRNSSYSWLQNLYYDGANRLSAATENSGWTRNYDYDRWGNRAVTTTGLAHTDSREPTSVSSFDSSTNRLTIAGAQYDAAGNQWYYSPYTLTYDAEGRNTTVTSTNSGNGSFAYDGEGRRVKKVWTPYGGSTATTYYTYDALGHLAAEYSDQAPMSTGTNWLTDDMLGSVRAVTSESGAVLECYDYLPFGRMLSSADNARSAVCCYPSNPDVQISSREPQKFSGKERDAETGLDYFLARYYSGAQGRFTSPDKPLMDQHIEDPQSWNLYAYGRNNPLIYIDPAGKAIELTGDEEERKKSLKLLQQAMRDSEAALSLYLKPVKDGDRTRYFVGIKGDVGEFMKLSDTAHDLANLVKHKKIVEFGVTSQDLSKWSGSATFEPGKVGNENVRVLVNPAQMYITNRVLDPHTFLGASRFEGQRQQPRWDVKPFNSEIVTWHEFGHAWGFINGRNLPLTNPEALDWENRMRESLYGQLGPKNARRILH